MVLHPGVWNSGTVLHAGQTKDTNNGLNEKSVPSGKCQQMSKYNGGHNQ